MATGSPVLFWYGTRAQFDSIITKLDTTLYFITDEHTIYKGTVKYSDAGVENMTTAERTAITPSAGQLIYDTDLETLYVGDGSTQGGVAVGSGGGGGGTVTGIAASVSGNTATIYATGSTTSVKLVGINGTTVSEGENGEIQVGGETPIIGSTVSGNTATITLENGDGDVKLVGINGTTVSKGANGEIQIRSRDGTVTGIGASVSGNTATISATGSTTSVKLVGVDGTTVSAGANGVVQIGGGGMPATVEDIMTGSGASDILNVTNIRGALTTGQAVDVTSQPDGVSGDYKGTFNVTGSLGFASFPKYASGLNYLMIADLTATTTGTVTPSGTWLDGTTTAKSLEAGTSTRVAMAFNAVNKAKFTFSSTGSVSVSNCREYEVTACSNEAVAYIASLDNPDAFASFYLVKADMVQPWTYIIDMGTSPAVTIASGLSYKLNAATGTHQLTVDTCPAGYDGRDAIIRIRLGGTGVIQAIPPLQLGDALVPYAINNCVVRFRDGEAVLLVEDTLAGYVVNVTSGTDNGSLAYGLAATGVPYIAFSTGTDGSVVDMGNAVTANEEVTVVGNGYTDTTITGNIECTNKTTVANLGLQDVTVTGGTMTLGDAYIPSGSTVAVDVGGLVIEKVTGNGLISGTSGTVTLTSGAVVDLTGNTNPTPIAPGGGITFERGGATVLTGATVGVVDAQYMLGGVTVPQIDNTNVVTISSAYMPLVASGCSIYFDIPSDSLPRTSNGLSYYFSDVSMQTNRTYFQAAYTSSNITLDKHVSFNKYLSGRNASAVANITILNGAIVDFTGVTNSTLINCRSGKLIVGTGCSVITSDGTTVPIAAGTYTSIDSNGQPT